MAEDRPTVELRRAPRQRSPGAPGLPTHAEAEYLAAVLNALGEGITVQDPQGRLEYANDQAAHLMGFRDADELLSARPQDVLGRFELFDADGAPFPASDLPGRRALQDGKPRTALLQWRARDSPQKHWSTVAAQPVMAPDGALRFVINTVRDVTDSRRLEQAHGHLAAVIESSEDAVVSKSLAGVVSTWNRAAERIFGYTSREMEGQPILRIVPPEKQEEEGLILASVRDGRTYRAYESVRMHKDGRRVQVSLTVSPIKDAAGRVIGASTIARDITARKRAEEELARVTQELERRVERRTAELQAAVADLESFNAAVSHDLRTPLRAITGFVDVMRRTGGLTGPHRNALRHIDEATRRMAATVDALLRLARLGRSRLDRADVDLSSAAYAILARQASTEPDRRAKWDVEPGLVASADPALVQVALENLLTNAWKFTRSRPEARISFGRTWRGGKDWFYVRDNGIGFDTVRDAPRLFKPFQRLHPNRSEDGIGIGLSTVQRIVHRHGGSIDVAAAPDQGATFYFRLG